MLLESDYDAAADTETDVRYYVYGNYIDEVLVMFNMSTSGITTPFYYAHDHLYSPVALFSRSGDVVERYEYDAYGKASLLSPNYELRTASLFSNPYLFTGRRLDTMDSGSLTIYHYRARGYDADTGRFMQRDPLRYIDGLNPFVYVSNRPIIYMDALGLSKKIFLDTPRTDKKCAQVEAIMNAGRIKAIFGKDTNLQRSFTLYDWWLSGNHKDESMTIPMDWFNKGEAGVDLLVVHYTDKVKDNLSRTTLNLECGESTGWAHEITDTRGYHSPVQMINAYYLTTVVHRKSKKNCVNNCCKSIEHELKMHFAAWDKTDFNLGEDFEVPGMNMKITDDLINACYPDHGDFYISADTERTETFSEPCK